MTEVEAKILEVDKEKLIEQLKLLGAKEVFDGEIDAHYYDTPDRILKKEKKTLRLRKEGDQAVLTSKKSINRDKAKIEEEYEIEMNDFEETEKILNNIGFVEFAQQPKHRTSLHLGNICFEFDTLPGIPTFLEIEAPTIEDIEQYTKKLGFKKEDLKPWTGKDVLKHYKKA